MTTINCFTPPAERPKLYLAGPEVFLDDPRAVAAEKKRLCAEAGFEGVFPLDGHIDTAAVADARARLAALGVAVADQRRAIGHAIFLANRDLIRRACWGVVANLTPFRGPSADVGTVWEAAWADGFGKPVAAYRNDSCDYLTRVAANPVFGPLETRERAFVDRLGLSVEDFAMGDNLMIDSALAEGGMPVVDHGPCSGTWSLERFTAALELLRRLATA